MTSTHPKSESALLLAMANAQTTDEQRQIAAELETVRSAKRTQDEADRMSSLSLAALAFPDSDTERHTSTASSDWLGDIEVPQVDRTEMENQMRAQATVWLQGRPAEVRADGEEFRTQAASKAHYLSNHFPGHREAAAEAFLDQIRTLAVEDWARADDDAVSVSDADQHEKVEFEGATADEEAETSASDSPSLAEGTEPEGDTPMDDSDPAWQGKNHDDSTFNREDAGQTVARRKTAASTSNLSVGDRVMLTQDGKEREFEVTFVSPSGSTGRAESAGPRVTVTLVGGKGYSVSFDNHSQPGISSWSKVSARKTAATVTDPSSLKAGDVVSFGSGDSAHSGPLVKDEDGNLGVEGPGEGEWTGVVAYRDGKASWNAVSEVRTGSRKTAVRKTTRFEPCDAHKDGWASGVSRRRLAENWVEGGPLDYDGPCSPNLCEIVPGTDFYGESSLDEVANIAASWAVNRGRTASRKTAISLSNVGVESDTVGTGTDPSGKKVRFSITPAEAKQLKDILFSDLAVNFSGVDVEESDIIKESSRRVTAVQKSKKDLKSGDSYQDEMGTVYRVVSEPVLEDYLGIGEMSWSMSIADGGGNGFWDSWGEDEDPKVDFLGSADATMGMPSFSSRRRKTAISDAEKDKVIPSMGYEVTRADVEAAMALPSGSRPRIYAYWDNGTGNPQVVKITSQHYLDEYGPDVEFYWGTNATMDNIGDWMVSRASRRQAASRAGDDFSWAFDKEKSSSRRKKVSNRRVAHNGWTNWDTWNAALWINNEEGIYRAALGTESPEALRDLVEDFGLTGDGFDSGKVNWEEVWTDSEFGPNHQGSRRTAAEGQTCSVCGDKIAKDPEGGGGYHHDNGEKHDHEAKPSGEAKEGSRRKVTASDEKVMDFDPNSSPLNARQAEGHENRMGHPLKGYYVATADEGILKLVRTCCGENKEALAYEAFSRMAGGRTPFGRSPRQVQAAVGDVCWSCGGKGYYRTPMGDQWGGSDSGQMMEVTCSTCGGSGVVNEPDEYPLADDPIFTGSRNEPSDDAVYRAARSLRIQPEDVWAVLRSSASSWSLARRLRIQPEDVEYIRRRFGRTASRKVDTSRRTAGGGEAWQAAQEGGHASQVEFALSMWGVPEDQIDSATQDFLAQWDGSGDAGEQAQQWYDSRTASRKTAREAMVCETCGREVEHADWDRCPHCGSSAGAEWETVASRRKTARSWIYSLKQIVESGQDGQIDGLPVGVELATGIVQATQTEGGRALLDRPFHEVYDMAVKAFAGAVFSSKRESSRRNHPSAGVDFSWAFANSKNSRKVQK